MVPSARMILASESPRRRELLAAVGVPFRVVPSGVDEIPRPGESPSRFVRRAALDKGEAVASLHRSSFVLSADTIVVADGRILGKPRNRAEARRMLSRLAGREHRVYTAICLLCRERGFRDVDTEVTRVRFRPLTAAEIAAYARTGECDDKAGAYAAQGAGMRLIDRVAGSFSNVVGLPMTRVVAMLARARLIRVTRSGPSLYAFSGTGR
ncbi:MAG TPA: nucleoside triphosphate pyrophosphatase [Candidatus Binatia bacterium]|nr:nucleoside triphosphate pyrophosphatase [Candidatus Binatia bacterium]